MTHTYDSSLPQANPKLQNLEEVQIAFEMLGLGRIDFHGRGV